VIDSNVLCRLQSLESELARQQRHSRRVLKFVPLTAFLSGVAGMWFGSAALSPVHAQQSTPAIHQLEAPFVVTDRNGQALFRVDGSGTLVRGSLNVSGPATPFILIGDRAKGSVEIGVGNGGSGFVLTRTPAGVNSLSLGPYGGWPTGMYVLDNTGETPRASLTAGRVFAGEEGKGAFYAGVGNSGQGYLLTRWANGGDAFRLGSYDGNPLAIAVLNSDGKQQASLGLDSSGMGILRVGSSDGPRTVAGVASGGASLALYDTAGTQYRIGLLGSSASTFLHLRTGDRSIRFDTEAAGSSLRVAAAKRSVQVNVNAEGGAVHVFNTAGNAVGSLTENASGRGRLSLGDAGGQTIVEAGSTADGLGVVRAGPSFGATSVPGMPPSALLGHKGK
jgi:hypothetical protein